MGMTTKKESLEDTIRRVLGEEREKEKADADLQDLIKKNPVEGLRALIRGEIDGARKRDIDAEEKPSRDEGDEGDNGILAFLGRK